MNQITYLLSEQFAYEKTIHADAGPDYARRQQWVAAPLSHLREALSLGPTLIDNRVTAEEMPEISQLLPTIRRYPLYVKVVDPYWECIRQPYYRWLLALTRFPQVCFIGPYQATGITTLLRDLSRPDAYLHIPYAYEKERELPLNPTARPKCLAFSGATHPDFYPERAAMLRALKHHWWIARRVSVLPHPGYPDVGQVAIHKITGDHYLRFLARHSFMYLEPSRESLEFLKYSECAYAGCVPAGQAPETFPDELRELISPIKSSSLPGDLRRLAATPVAMREQTAQAYRDGLRRLRNPQTLNVALQAHWQQQIEQLASNH